jgi:glycolate oxidase iron-sulfur subunit
MQHKIQPEEHGPMGKLMAEAVQTCVHCGFCLAACPTYNLKGQEMDTPRGRIMLMKDVLEENLALEKALPHIDQCLGCLSCETACPSGVEYNHLLAPFREMAEKERPKTFLSNLKRKMLLETLPNPKRFKTAASLGKFAKPFKGMIPKVFQPMLELLPDELPPAEKLDPIYPAQGKFRGKVALLAGCAQQVLAPEINRATINVLTRNGVEVLVPETQQCCGALAWHVGEADAARENARANLNAFPKDVDAIITNAAGCGSGLHEYSLMLKGQAEEETAKDFVRKVTDISSFLIELGIETPPALSRPVKIAYQDACHLRHAQKVQTPPRQLLLSIPNLEIVEMPEADICCGSAGTYNIDQPENAHELGERKMKHILDTEAEFAASGNIGCLAQLKAHLGDRSTPKLMHTIEILEEAYNGRLI